MPRKHGLSLLAKLIVDFAVKTALQTLIYINNARDTGQFFSVDIGRDAAIALAGHGILTLETHCYIRKHCFSKH